MTKKYLNCFASIFIAILFWQCAGGDDKPGFIGRIYQNTTARYNAYFLGKERLAEVEAKIVAASPNDYNQVLPLFASTDTVITSPFRKDLEEVIKKASFAIKRHPHSRWTDDSYILVGRARYHLGDFDEAIKNFRFVNTLSNTDQTRYLAQIWLMRAFIAAKDYESADAVSDLLKKVTLDKSNARELFLNRANYALQQKNTKLAIDNLYLAVPLIEVKDDRTRVEFILAQLYQLTGQDKMAYEIYSRLIKHNPPYELGFYSKLNLGQVTELSNPNDKERIEKYYAKLLKDTKNVDFKDKIYYEMARFALKQQQYAPALAYLQQATKASTTNQTQKAYAYLLSGKIYYENLQKYRLAYSYYDSAVQIMPPTSAEYAATAERRDVLNEFAYQYTVIQTQDSLQALAKLDTASLNKRITGILTAAAEKQKALAEQQLPPGLPAGGNPADGNPALNNPALNAPNNRARPGSDLTASANAGGAWYFDNAALVSRARSEFQRRWGTRRLQDNWRLSSQPATSVAQAPANATQNAAASPDSAAALARQNSIGGRQALLQNIPLTPAQMRTSNTEVEEAMFNLGNIYRLQLQEPARAAETYEKLLQRFPATKYKSEVYYSLFLIYQQEKNERAKVYADLIKKEFPGTKYAKLIVQPDYLQQVSANNKQARQLYDSAFSNYRHERYSTAVTLVNQVRKQYPDNELTDRVAFLEVLISGRTQKPAVFKDNISNFIKKYPESTLLPRAQELLTAFQAFESGKLSEAEFNKTHRATTKATAPVVPESETVAEAIPEVENTPPDAASRLAATPPKRRNRDKPIDPAPATEETETEATQEDPIAEEAADEKEPTNPATPAAANIRTPANNPAPAGGKANVAPPGVPAAAKPAYVANLALPHVVVVAYPQNNPAFKGIFKKLTAYNNQYNQAAKLTIDSMAFNGTTQLLVIKEFPGGKPAVGYATKQKAPQSPLSKIRGIDFATFAISSGNLPLLLKEGKLEDYLTFYKSSYF